MLLISGVSQRRAAKLCSTTQITVARKLVRMAKFAQIAHEARLAGMKKSVTTAIFDEMEAFEHSKCKPVAIAVAVEEGSRIILSAVAASMPALSGAGAKAPAGLGTQDLQGAQKVWALGVLAITAPGAAM